MLGAGDAPVFPLAAVVIWGRFTPRVCSVLSAIIPPVSHAPNELEELHWTSPLEPPGDPPAPVFWSVPQENVFVAASYSNFDVEAVSQSGMTLSWNVVPLPMSAASSVDVVLFVPPLLIGKVPVTSAPRSIGSHVGVPSASKSRINSFVQSAPP